MMSASVSPRAFAGALVLCNAHSRFTVLSPRVIRAEYSPSSVFEDRATLTILRRNLPTPRFEVANGSDGWCNVTVMHDDGSVGIVSSMRREAVDHHSYGFAAHQLQMHGAGWTWHFGEKPKGNLLGTLQGIGGLDPNYPSPDLRACCSGCKDARAGNCGPLYDLQEGLLSTDGWSLVDDSNSTALDTEPHSVLEDVLRTSWPSQRPRLLGNSDIYLFGCGRAYRECLADFTALSGPIALPPLPALGIWWSRHWGDTSGNREMVEAVGVMSEANIQAQVLDGYASRNLPLHVLVLDMEWHEQLAAPQCSDFVGIKAWGGYTWNRSLFAEPDAFVTSLHASRGPLGVQLALNYHSDYGVDACQTAYTKMAKVVGIDPATREKLPDLLTRDRSKRLAPGQYANRTFVDAFFKHVLLPTLADYAWLDQPDASTWVNDLFVRYLEQQDGRGVAGPKRRRRGINFSRYGGLGNHRTPVGFSGDTQRQWETLQYEVYMTPRASNVAFGWWSHDIGGFSGGFVDDIWHTEEPELFLRWLQFATFAPIFRTHCRYCDQRIWTWARYDAATHLDGVGWFSLMRETMLLRNALVPYIYTHAATRTHAAGESLLTPMYYDTAAEAHPDAYSHLAQQQYWFGSALLVAPITEKCAVASDRGCKVERAVWLPPIKMDECSWVAWGSWEVLGRGPVVVHRNSSLADMPVFARSGAVLPMRDMASAYLPAADPLLWLIVPGSAIGAGLLYEDDGVTVDHRYGSSATTSFTHQWQGSLAPGAPGSSWHATISATNGSYEGMPTAREHRAALKGVRRLPQTASCDGVAITSTKVGVAPGFWMEADVPADVQPGAPFSLIFACGQLKSSIAHALVAHF